MPSTIHGGINFLSWNFFFLPKNCSMRPAISTAKSIPIWLMVTLGLTKNNQYANSQPHTAAFWNWLPFSYFILFSLPSFFTFPSSPNGPGTAFHFPFSKFAMLFPSDLRVNYHFLNFLFFLSFSLGLFVAEGGVEGPDHDR